MGDQGLEALSRAARTGRTSSTASSSAGRQQRGPSGARKAIALVDAQTTGVSSAPEQRLGDESVRPGRPPGVIHDEERRVRLGQLLLDPSCNDG